MKKNLFSSIPFIYFFEKASEIMNLTALTISNALRKKCAILSL